MRTALLTIMMLFLVGIAHAQQTQTPLIAFIEEGNLYTWQDGIRNALVETGHIDRVWLNSEGTQVAYIQSDGRVQKPGYDHLNIADYQYESTSLWMIDIDGSNLRQLIDLDHYRGGYDYGTSIFIDELEWVSGTSLIVFNTYEMSEVASYSHPHVHIYALDTETGQVSLRYQSDEEGSFSVSPDGIYAVSRTETSISLFPLSGIGNGDGGVPEAVTLYSYERSANDFHNYYYPSVQWSADSQSLIAIDLTSRVGWSETDDDGNDIFPAITIVKIYLDGTSEILASVEHPALAYWTLRFTADGSQAIYSTDQSENCDFVALPLETNLQLEPQLHNTVMCSGRDIFSFIALTPSGDMYLLEQAENGATLSRVCDDFVACEVVQKIDGTVRSLDFIDDSHYIYRLRDAAADTDIPYRDVFHELRELYYVELGGEPQLIGILPRYFPDNVFSVQSP